MSAYTIWVQNTRLRYFRVRHTTWVLGTQYWSGTDVPDPMAALPYSVSAWYRIPDCGILRGIGIPWVLLVRGTKGRWHYWVPQFGIPDRYRLT